MAHFAEIDENNIVIRTLVVPDEQENRGQEYLSVDCGLGGRWIQTSFNTNSGIHRLGGTPLRVNHAGVGWYYDEDKDAFVQPKPLEGEWTFNETTLQWDPNPTY